MLDLTRPAFVVPVHGAPEMLAAAKRVAVDHGAVAPERCFVMGNGEVPRESGASTPLLRFGASATGL